MTARGGRCDIAGDAGTAVVGWSEGDGDGGGWVCVGCGGFVGGDLIDGVVYRCVGLELEGRFFAEDFEIVGSGRLEFFGVAMGCWASSEEIVLVMISTTA